MKVFVFILYSSFLMLFPSLTKVRADYVLAVYDKEVTLQLNKDLSEIRKSDNKVLLAYKGAVLTLMAKFTKSIKEKKAYFKQGALLLEYAVSEKPANIEIRFVRLGVQENTPKIVGYRKNKEEDKQFIIDHFSEISSKELKSYFLGFIMQSKSFTEDEKKLFN